MRKSQRSIVSGQWFAFKSCKKLFLLLTSCFLFLVSFSQSVSASLDRDKILLGEQVTMQLNLTGVNPLLLFVVSWPQINDTLNHIEVIKRSSIDTIEVNGTNTFQQNFIITGFDSGRWQLGPFNFILKDKTTGKQIAIASPAVYLTVLPVDVSAMKTYHPLKDIIEVQTPFNWLPVIIGAAVLIAAIVVFIIIKKIKSKRIVAPKTILSGTPIQRALEKLQQLQDEPLQTDVQIKKFHSDIDIICRKYFEETTNAQPMQATTNELLQSIKVFIPDATLRIKMYEIFEMNASVKFAKYMPPVIQSQTILQDVIFNLNQLDNLTQQVMHNANSLA